jgi:RNA polymerase sigma-70 factor (ECF subfamily)
LLGDWHHAEDVLVTTFTKLATSELKEKGSLKAWLYRVATNQCYRIFRKRREIQFSEAEFLENIEDPGPHIARQVKVQKLLLDLPDSQRIAVVLKFYENMSYQEIAEVLCCPLGTIKSRMHEAIKNLRRRLNGLQKY